MAKINWDEVREGLKRDVRSITQSALEGTVDDLQGYADAIAEGITVAASTNDQESLKHLEAQAKMLKGRFRVRATEAQWSVASAAFLALARTVISVVASVAVGGSE